jgi:D-inositol-3-phosphate glycosyltransferase
MVRGHKNRLAIVGPVTPFRSGVAKHTTELARALSIIDETDVAVYSFKRQYPRFLYPGDDDRVPDFDDGFSNDLEVQFLIDSINPFTWWRTAARLKQDNIDQVILPAWTFFLAPCLGTIARICRKADIQVVMIVHNFEDHETSRWKAWLSRFQLKQADRYVTHGSVLADQISTMGCGKPVQVCPHPIFEQYPDPVGKLPRRAKLELLFFGLIRNYKGLDIALHGLAKSGRQDIMMTVVGEFWEGKEATHELIEELDVRDKVEVVPRYVSDAEAAEYFARADVVILPYRTVSGSGVIPVAYRYGKPVIVSDLPGLTDVVDEGETGWFVPAEDSDAIGCLLSEVVTTERVETMKEAIALKRKELSWERFAEVVLVNEK